MTDQESVLLPVADTAGDDRPVVTETGGLRGGRCQSCGAGSFPRAYICPSCNNTTIEEAELPGEGSLYTWTTVHISPTFPTPYTLGYIDLSDGLRLLAQVLAPQEQLRCDLPVRLVSSDQSPTGWGFVPVEGATA
ncbi:Zn-ribbon domain-containing OB-fold protein [Aeromicrobium phragmitis]|nr:OB-fold domain-containing protein [Aeromicrobium phragmitis]